MINSIDYVKILEEAGFTRDQAEASMRVIQELIFHNLATKHDMERIEFKLTQLKNEMTIRLGAMMVVAVGAIVALQKLI